MTIKIIYTKKNIIIRDSNIILFSDEKFSLNNLKKYLATYEYNYLKELLKTADKKKKLFIYEIS